MKGCIISFACLWMSICCNAQDASKSETNKIIFTGFASVGRSTFQSSITAPSKFPSLEFRLGAGVSKPLNRFFELRSRLTLGIKLKREAFNKPGQGYTMGPPFLSLDEVASQSHHFFYEIPLLVQFNFAHPKIGLRVGGNFRSFLSNNEAFDFLAGKKEFGLIAGAYYRMNEKLTAGLDYYFGITKIYEAEGTVDTSDYSLYVRNQFAQLTVEYHFRK